MNIPVAYEGNKPYIFISYAHRNSDRVIPIIAGLQNRGFRVWYDAGIEAGTEWPEYIAEHLRKCGCFVAFITGEALASQNCRREINFAISKNLPMLSVYLEEVELTSGMEMQLGTVQALYRFRHTDEASFLQMLYQAAILRKCRDGSATEASVLADPEELLPVLQDDGVCYPLELLDPPPVRTETDRDEMEERMARSLAEQQIKCRIIGVITGIQATRYDVAMKTADGRMRLAACADQLAKAMGVEKIRIGAPEGAGIVVSLEVPNPEMKAMTLREILEDEMFLVEESPSAFAVGQSMDREAVVRDLAEMPNLLIGGHAESGKDPWLHGLLLSMLHRANPGQLRLILIDSPKQLLRPYQDLAHLMVPVVETAAAGIEALRWVDAEATRRNKLLGKAGVKDLQAYNTPGLGVDRKPLPRLVVVIAELAALMEADGDDTEMQILRIARKSEALGIHLVVATERMNADVLTGLIKSMIPAKIAFAMRSGANSKAVLDDIGAECLTGRGDLLFKTGKMEPVLRIQGCQVCREELERVLRYLRERMPPAYDAAAAAAIAACAEKNDPVAVCENTVSMPAMDWDPLLENAVALVLEHGSAYTSLLQRKMGLGYGRAARLMDQMEACGVIGPYEGPKPREVIVDEESWAAIKKQLG